MSARQVWVFFGLHVGRMSWADLERHATRGGWRGKVARLEIERRRGLEEG